MTPTTTNRVNLFAALVAQWRCKCGHGPTRHCTRCGVCHINQAGGGNPFASWCGCIHPVPLWVRMALR